MRRALTWLAGLAGIAALVRRRGRPKAPATNLVSMAPDPAVELRKKLDDSRGAAPASADTVDDSGSLDERRARVHERAQVAIDLMRGADDPSVDHEESP